MALTTLVATMPTAKRTTENKTVPRMPTSTVFSAGHIQSLRFVLLARAVTATTPQVYDGNTEYNPKEYRRNGNDPGDLEKCGYHTYDRTDDDCSYGAIAFAVTAE